MIGSGNAEDARTPHILVCGANGQLGRSLRALAREQPDDARYFFASRQELDISSSKAIHAWLDETGADCLINAAAYTMVDKARLDYDLALAANAYGPGLLAKACAARNISLLHVSTDHVFDGLSGKAYTESDQPSPANCYGQSKYLGEQEIQKNHPAAAIVRTSWLFSAWEPNFVLAMLRLARTKNCLRIVNDQFGGPTWAGHLAKALHTLAILPETAPGGIYHFAGRPWASRHDFALEIFKQAVAHGLVTEMPEVQAISTAQWLAAEPRPPDCRLAGSKLETLTGPMEQDWRRGLTDVMRALS